MQVVIQASLMQVETLNNLPLTERGDYYYSAVLRYKEKEIGNKLKEAIFMAFIHGNAKILDIIDEDVSRIVGSRGIIFTRPDVVKFMTTLGCDKASLWHQVVLKNIQMCIFCFCGGVIARVQNFDTPEFLSGTCRFCMTALCRNILKIDVKCPNQLVIQISQDKIDIPVNLKFEILTSLMRGVGDESPECQCSDDCSCSHMSLNITDSSLSLDDKYQIFNRAFADKNYMQNVDVRPFIKFQNILYTENGKLRDELEKAKAEIQLLQTQIEYAPDTGSGFQKAKARFQTGKYDD